MGTRAGEFATLRTYYSSDHSVVHLNWTTLAYHTSNIIPNYTYIYAWWWEGRVCWSYGRLYSVSVVFARAKRMLIVIRNAHWKLFVYRRIQLVRTMLFLLVHLNPATNVYVYHKRSQWKWSRCWHRNAYTPGVCECVGLVAKQMCDYRRTAEAPALARGNQISDLLQHSDPDNSEAL